MTSRDAETFGTLLKGYRTRAGISQEQLAEDAQLSVETISSLERGVRRNPYGETVALLAAALGLSTVERERFALSAARPDSGGRPTLRSSTGTDGNLPLQLTSFVGRDAEIATIYNALRSHRLVTVTGSGGSGKTRVALRVAAELRDTAPDGVWLIDLTPLADGSNIPNAVGAVMPFAKGFDGLQSLVGALSRKKLVLLFDNCEHVIADVRRVVTALLTQCPGVTVLATSRETLGVAGEGVCRIGALTESDAIALFTDRSRAVDANFAVTDRTASVIGEICRKLDRLPFAIELAATRTATFSVVDLRNALNDRFRFLQGSNRSGAPRQRTLRDLLDWSYDLLDAKESALLRRVGIFPGTFSIDAVAAICLGDADDLDVVELVSSLVDKSLVVASVRGEETRYGLLQTARLYARERLTGHERSETEERYVAFFRNAVFAAERDFAAAGTDRSFEVLAAEIDNVRDAVRRSFETADAADSARFAAAAARVFVCAGVADEGVHWLERALAVAPEADVALQARCWSALSHLLGSHGGARAFEAAERAVFYARADGAAGRTGRALLDYATGALFQLRSDLARAAFDEAEGLFGDEPQPHQRAALLAVRLHFLRIEGAYDACVETARELAAIYRTLGNTADELIALLNLGEIFHAKGESEAAILVVREALERAATHREMQGCLLMNLTAYLCAVDDAAGALSIGARALDALAASGPGALAIAIGHLALAHALSGEIRRAARLFGFWQAASRRLGIRVDGTERVASDRIGALLSERLGAAERDALYATGALLDLGAAIELAVSGPIAAPPRVTR